MEARTSVTLAVKNPRGPPPGSLLVVTALAMLGMRSIKLRQCLIQIG